jgi:tetratricopeptide (TPR) repeat protein
MAASATAPQVLCADASCRVPLHPPLLQCAKCKAAAYCSKACQTRDWMAGHKRDCRQGAAATAARRALQVQVQAARQVQRPSRSSAQPVMMTNRQNRVCCTIEELVQAGNWWGLVAMEAKARTVAEELRVVRHPNAARIFGTLGRCCRALGQYTKAIELHEQRRVIAEEAGDRAEQGSACGDLGNLYNSLGQCAEAIELHEQRRAIAQEMGDRAGQGVACSGLGSCYMSWGQFAKAIELHEQHQAIAEEVGDRTGLGGTCANLGICYKSLGQYSKAIELHEQAWAIAEEVGDRDGLGKVCTNLGSCYKSLEQYEKAIELFKQGLEMCEELGDLDGTMQACRGLGESLTWLGDFTQAMQHHKRYWALAKQLGIAPQQALAALSCGNTLLTQALAEHQAAADGPLQMQKKSAEHLGEAQEWLKTALEGNKVAPILSIDLDVNLSLSCLAFVMSKITPSSGRFSEVSRLLQAEALKFLRAHLDLCVKHARDSCAGCWQRRGEDAPNLLTCGGCKVARSVLHLRISSLDHNTNLAMQLLFL